MSKFSTKKQQELAAARGQVRTAGPDVTYEGGLGAGRDAKSELFLLGISNLVGESTFYEDAATRDTRYADLVRVITAEDPEWVGVYGSWLRNSLQLRSASIVTAAEYVAAGGPYGRGLISAVCQRPDEPAELLAYWFISHGRRIPAAIKRGLADAVTRLYDEKAALKYDGRGKAWRMGDVVELVHPKPKAPWQSQLFRFLIDSGKDRETIKIGPDLPVIRARKQLEEIHPSLRRQAIAPNVLEAAGMTWESLSGWLGGPMDAHAWEAIIPSMGYMALLRNLRNFEEAGVDKTMMASIASKLADPEQVSRSKQFPIRFLSAWLANPSMTFGPALERALELSVANVPSLPGSSLIMIDCSGSMWGESYSKRSRTLPYQTAGIFGFALAQRAAAADVVAYGTSSVPIQYHGSILRLIDRLESMGGTNTWEAVERHYAGHDRVIILTDEQASPSFRSITEIPRVYTFNLQGYKVSHTEDRPGWYTFGGGLTDACFKLLAVLDAGYDTGWPWEEKNSV